MLSNIYILLFIYSLSVDMHVNVEVRELPVGIEVLIFTLWVLKVEFRLAAWRQVSLSSESFPRSSYSFYFIIIIIF